MAIGEPTNGAKEQIVLDYPFVVHATIQGSTDILFHRWNCEAVIEKANAKKGSEAKKTDNVESYVWRNDEGILCLPSEYVRMSIVNAAKFRQDPRSPRKSAYDLYRAAIVALEPMCSFFNVARELPRVWDYEDKRRVTVQRNGVNRIRPAFRVGWTAQVDFMCVLPGYVSADDMHETLTMAGQVIGVADFRPTFGRFRVTRFEAAKAEL
jgi:hypothetical protein